MKQTKMLIATAALLSVIAGSVAGINSIFQNEYWKHAYYYLAFDELTVLINRFLYVVAAAAVIFALVLTGFRLTMKSVWKLAVLIAAVAGFVVLAEKFDLDYHANLVWNEMPLAAQVSVILLFLIYVDLIVGKKWLGFLSGKTAWRAAAVCLAIPVLLNMTSWLWFNRLQKNLAAQPNILIITVDALRADHVRSLGYERNTTPCIDSLAAAGVLFTQAASNSNATRSTVPAIFTMLYPSVHGIMGADGRVLSPRFVTLAEILKNQGYATHAYMPNGPLRRIFNFDQGFDIYDDRIMGMGKLERFDSALPINASIRKWIGGNAGKKFFMYIHYVEPHSPYEPPPAYDKMFYGPEAAKHVRKISVKEFERMKRKSGEASTLEINDVNFYIAQYDAEIRYIDDQIRTLLDYLRQRGVLDNTAIFLTADHGEAFLEHGHWMHTTASLYEEVVHVPIIAYLPKSDRQGQRLEAPVHTFDISATILDLLDLTPDFVIQAKSFLPVINGEIERQWEYTFSESPQDKVLRNREWKFRLAQSGKNRQELYYLPDDPQEKNNLVREKNEKAKEMLRLLMTFVQTNEKLSAGHQVEMTSMDQETVQQLKALGYIK